MTILKKNDKILAKYSIKRTKLHHFLKIFSVEHAPEPPYQTRSFAPCKYPHFSRKILNLPEMKS